MTALNWSAFLRFLDRYNHGLTVEIGQGRSLTVGSIRIDHSKVSIQCSTLQALSVPHLV